MDVLDCKFVTSWGRNAPNMPQNASESSVVVLLVHDQCLERLYNCTWIIIIIIILSQVAHKLYTSCTQVNTPDKHLLPKHL